MILITKFLRQITFIFTYVLQWNSDAESCLQKALKLANFEGFSSLRHKGHSFSVQKMRHCDTDRSLWHPSLQYVTSLRDFDKKTKKAKKT